MAAEFTVHVRALHLADHKISAHGGTVSSGLMNKHPLGRMILELEKLQVVEDANGNIRDLEKTRKYKDILEALEKVSWW